MIQRADGLNLGEFIVYNFSYVELPPVTDPIPEQPIEPVPEPEPIPEPIPSSGIPITMGVLFPPGKVPEGKKILVKNKTTGTIYPTQTDLKCKHKDKSMLNSVVSFLHTDNNVGELDYVIDTTSDDPSGNIITKTDLLSTNFDASVHIISAGIIYSAYARELIEADVKYTWLQGSICSEFQVVGSLVSDTGVKHPHLMARFYVRFYANNCAWVRVIVENCRYLKDAIDTSTAFKSATFMDYIGDISVKIGEQVAFTKTAFNNVRQTRWTEDFWWNIVAPDIYIQPDSKMLGYMLSGAVPNYKPVVVPQSAYDEQEVLWNKRSSIGSIGLCRPSMPDTGAADDIGPLPKWDARYLNTPNKLGFKHIVGTSKRSGSWQIHVRNEKTDYPVTIDDYPYICGPWNDSGNVGDSLNPATGQNEYLPTTSTAGKWEPYVVDGIKLNPDTAHQPRLGYLAYLLTGDYYHLEELHFWATWNMVRMMPAYRNFSKGELQKNQPRGVAWAGFELTYAAFITPDGHPLKTYFADKLKANRDRMISEFIDNQAKSPLGIYTIGNGVLYNTDMNANGTTENAIQIWMHNFIGLWIAETANLGFEGWEGLHAWQSKLPIGAVTDPEYCEKQAGCYYNILQEPMAVYPDESGWATTFKDLLARSYPAAVGNCPTVYVGNPSNPESYTAQMMANLACSAPLDARAETARANHEAGMIAAGANFNLVPTFYTAPRGVAPTSNALNAPYDAWYQSEGNKLADVNPLVANNGLQAISQAEFDAIRGNSGFAGLFSYSGGCYNPLTDELEIDGGGHQDYFGNDRYALNIRSGAFRRTQNPGPMPYDVNQLPDFGPAAQHTYNFTVFVANKNAKYYMVGATGSTVTGSYPNACVVRFDYATKKFTKLVASPEVFFWAIFDPKSNAIWCRGAQNLHCFDLATETFIYKTNENTGEYMYDVGVDIDIQGRKIVVYGYNYSFYYDVTNKSAVTRTPLAISDQFNLKAANNGTLVYNPNVKKFIIFNGGKDLYAFDLKSQVMKFVPTAATSIIPSVNAGYPRYYKRFGYSYNTGMYYLAPHVDIKPYFLKLRTSAYGN